MEAAKSELAVLVKEAKAKNKSPSSVPTPSIVKIAQRRNLPAVEICNLFDEVRLSLN